MRGFFVFVAVLPVLTQAYFFWNREEQEAVADIDQACVEKANAGDCDFYICFDERHPCTSNNWALSYGWRFCKKFDQDFEKFNDAGKEYINATRICTMRNLLEFYNDDSINCANSERAMNRMHALCEREGGVCNLGLLLDNKDALLDIYSFSRHTLNRFLQFVRGCGEPEFREFVQNVREQADVAKPYLDAMEDALTDFVDDIRDRDWGLGSIELPNFDRMEMPSFDFSFGREDSEED